MYRFINVTQIEGSIYTINIDNILSFTELENKSTKILLKDHMSITVKETSDEIMEKIEKYY